MATYRVQVNDTPASIAQKFTGNPSYANIVALMNANPQKQRVVDAQGYQTFRSLMVNELLAIPASWIQPGYQPNYFPNFQPVFPEVVAQQPFNTDGRMAFFRSKGFGAPQGLGDPLSDSTAQAVVNLTGSPRLCTPNIAVLNFQKSHNATGPGTPLSEDGEYGHNTKAALDTWVSNAPPACSTFGAENATDLVNILNRVAADTTICAAPNDNVLAFQVCYNKVNNATLTADGKWGPASSAAGIGVGTNAPPGCASFGGGLPGGGATGATGATGASGASASNAPLIGLLVVAAAAGGLYYMNKHKGSTGGSPTLKTGRARLGRLLPRPR